MTAAPPKVVPPGLPTVDQAGGAAQPAGAPPELIKLLGQYHWIPEVLLALAILIAIALLLTLPVWLALALGAVFVGLVVYIYRLLERWQAASQAAETISGSGQMPGAVDRLPKSPDFTLSDPGSGVRPSVGGSDSPTASRFKDALRDSFALLDASAAAAPKFDPAKLDLPSGGPRRQSTT